MKRFLFKQSWSVAVSVIVAAGCTSGSQRADTGTPQQADAEVAAMFDAGTAADSGDALDVGGTPDSGTADAGLGDSGRPACESLYAASVAEILSCECDQIFGTGTCQRPSSLSPDRTGCRDDETANDCAHRTWSDADNAVGFEPPPMEVSRAHYGKYLPACLDGSTPPCEGQEVRCTDGTRPVIYGLKAHAANHTPVDSTFWVITMGGEGGPCSGEVTGLPNSEDCWNEYFTQRGSQRQSATTKSVWDLPPSQNRLGSGLHADRPVVNGEPNAFHRANRLLFQRCNDWASDGEETIHPTAAGVATWAGPTRVYHRGFRTAQAVFRSLTTTSGRDLGSAMGGPPDGDADDAVDLPSLADAEVIVLTASSDAARWLTHSADRLTMDLAAVAPQATVFVVIDSIWSPMLEGEFAQRYPYDMTRDSNGNGVNDIFDHITDNPDGLTAPFAPENSAPYGLRTYQEDGFSRKAVDNLSVPIDASCAEAHRDDPSLCYSHGHVIANHLSTPFMLIMDLRDNNVNISGWNSVLGEWSPADMQARVRAQGLDVARYFQANAGGDNDATVVGRPAPAIWMPNRGLHTHLQNNVRMEQSMLQCDAMSQPLARVDLNAAIAGWVAGTQVVAAVDGHQPSGAPYTWRTSCN